MIEDLQVPCAVAPDMACRHRVPIKLRPVVRHENRTGLGPTGVDIFFVLSSFIRVAATRGRDAAPVDFPGRVARLLPLDRFTDRCMTVPVVGFQPIGVREIRPSCVVQSLLFLPFPRGAFRSPRMAFAG